MYEILWKTYTWIKWQISILRSTLKDKNAPQLRQGLQLRSAYIYDNFVRIFPVMICSVISVRLFGRCYENIYRSGAEFIGSLFCDRGVFGDDNQYFIAECVYILYIVSKIWYMLCFCWQDRLRDISGSSLILLDKNLREFSVLVKQNSRKICII